MNDNIKVVVFNVFLELRFHDAVAVDVEMICCGVEVFECLKYDVRTFRFNE